MAEGRVKVRWIRDDIGIVERQQTGRGLVTEVASEAEALRYAAWGYCEFPVTKGEVPQPRREPDPAKLDPILKAMAAARAKASTD